MFWPGDSASCAEHEEPVSLRPCYGDDAHSHFKWLKIAKTRDRSFPRSFTKWAVRPVVVETYGARYPDVKAPFKVINEFGRLNRKMQEDRLGAAFPDGVESHAPWRSVPRGAWRGGPGFPYAWVCIEIFAGAMLENIDTY